MYDFSFCWDERKNDLNLKKHGISFEEAESVFFDEKALLISDPDHSSVEEERFILLGMSHRTRLLIVCHCYRGADHLVRIISARKASKPETLQYFQRA